MAVRLADATAYLNANDDGLKSGLDAGKRQVDGWGSAINGMLMGAGMAAFNAIAGVAQGTVAYLGDSVAAASDLSETVSKVDTLFGSSSAGIMQWAQNSATAMGLPKQAALDAVGTIGNLFMQLGASSDEAAGVGQNMVQLSADLASFHNVAGGSAEVLDAMSAAFRGEYDALQRYIPTINGAAVEQQALAMTGKESAKELTNLEKAMAVQAIMARDAGAAMGDFARTSGGLANQQRILDAQMADLQATVGAALLPVMATLTTLLNQMVQAVLPPLAAFIQDHVAPAMAGLATIAQGLIDIFIFGKEPMGDWSSWWEDIAAILGEDVAEALRGVGIYLYDLRNSIEKNVGPVLQAAMGWFAGLGTTVQAQTNGPLNFFNGWIAQNMPRIQQIVESVLGAITAFWEEHGAAIVEGVQRYLGWVMQFWELVFRTILNIVQVGLQVLTGDFEGAGQTLQAIVRDLWTSLSRIFSQMIDAIVDMWSSIDWGGIGRAMIEGIADGLRNAAGWLRDAAWDAAMAALDAARNALGIHSPSAVAAHEIGQPFAEGIGVGMRESMAALAGDVNAGLRGLVSGVQAPAMAGAGAPISITLNISGASDAQGASLAARDGVLAGLRAAGLR